MTRPTSLLAELASMARLSEDEELCQRLPLFEEADHVAQAIVLLEEPLRVKADGRLSEAARAFMDSHWDFDETWQKATKHFTYHDPVELPLDLTLPDIDAGYYIGVAVGWRMAEILRSGDEQGGA